MLMLPYLYSAPHWITKASIPLRWIFIQSGILIVMSRKTTRKPALMVTLIGCISVPLLYGILSSTAMAKANPEISNLIANVILLAIPYAYGIAGALVDALYKETLLLLEEKEKETEKEKEKQRQAVQPVLSVHGAPAARPAAAPVSPAATRGPAPVRRPPLPPQPKAAPASPAACPLPYPPHKSNDSGQDSPADLSLEEKLAAQKAAYEKRVGGQAAQKPTADMTPQEMLRKVTERVFSEGKAAAELGGQRQLVYWMARAVPPLNGLMQLESGKDFFAPALENNPAVFLPLLDKLLAEAARLLASSNKRTEKDAWSRMEPEEICAGWYALAKYTAAGGREQSFADAAARMERFIMKDKRCVAWLKENCAAEEEGILL